MKKKRRYYKKVTFLLVFILVLIVGSILLAKHVLPYAIIQPPRISVNVLPSDVNLESEEIHLVVEDSITLKGYWVRKDTIQPKSIMILLHGIGGCKEHFLQTAQQLAEMGIESVLMDARAHGKSGGQFCTYGFKEKKDISAVVDYIKSKNNTSKIGIWGNSMGGAIALQALAYDKRIEFGVIESTFTDLTQIVYDYQKSFTYGIGFRPLCNIALKEAGKIADFNPKEVAPIVSVKNIEQPVLIAHGDADKNIKFEYGKLLYDNLKSVEKEFVPVKNGGHHNLAEKGGSGYTEKLITFIIKSK